MKNAIMLGIFCFLAMSVGLYSGTSDARARFHFGIGVGGGHHYYPGYYPGYYHNYPYSYHNYGYGYPYYRGHHYSPYFNYGITVPLRSPSADPKYRINRLRRDIAKLKSEEAELTYKIKNKEAELSAIDKDRSITSKRRRSYSEKKIHRRIERLAKKRNRVREKLVRKQTELDSLKGVT